MNDEINRNQGMAVSDPKGAISDALREVSNGNCRAYVDKSERDVKKWLRY